jgi:hypothetical protein
MVYVDTGMEETDVYHRNEYSLLSFYWNNLRKVITKINFNIVRPGDYIYVIGGAHHDRNHYGCYVGVLKGTHNGVEGEFLAYTKPVCTFMDSINCFTVNCRDSGRDLYLVPLQWLISQVFIFVMGTDLYSLVDQ